VFVAAHPELGAVVLKLDDGGDRGRALALAAGLRSIGVPSEALAPWLQVPVLGGGRVVGEVLPAAALAS
jgi:hypothetical protein